MEINIAYQCSNSFLNPMLVSVYSFLHNNNWFDKMNLYILSSDFTSESKVKLMKMIDEFNVDYNVEIIKIPDFYEEFGLIFDNYNGKWGIDSFIRISLDHFLPNCVDRVLYFDADTLICKSIIDFYTTNLDGFLVAGVNDLISEYYMKFIGLTKNDYYFNSGVLLFNLNECRKFKLFEKVLNYSKKVNGFIFFSEQSVLNVLCRYKMKLMPFEFNVNSIAVSLNKVCIELLRNPIMKYSWDEINIAVKSPSILHMTSFFLVKNRAWFDKTNYKYRYIFNEYSSKVNDFQLFKDNRSFLKKIIDFFISIMPKTLICFVCGIYYNKFRLKKYKKYIRKREK